MITVPVGQFNSAISCSSWNCHMEMSISLCKPEFWIDVEARNKPGSYEAGLQLLNEPGTLINPHPVKKERQYIKRIWTKPGSFDIGLTAAQRSWNSKPWILRRWNDSTWKFKRETPYQKWSWTGGGSHRFGFVRYCFVVLLSFHFVAFLLDFLNLGLVWVCVR